MLVWVESHMPLSPLQFLGLGSQRFGLRVQDWAWRSCCFWPGDLKRLDVRSTGVCAVSLAQYLEAFFHLCVWLQVIPTPNGR